MASPLYIIFSRARSTAAKKVNVADSHQQRKKGEKITTPNFIFREVL